ncbi:hypothetical protein ACSSS7_004659 [Eimeria intestinalis]
MEHLRSGPSPAELSITYVKYLVAPWTHDYMHRVDYRGVDGHSGQHRVDVIFCKLTPQKPVAEVEAKVHFMLSFLWLDRLHLRAAPDAGCEAFHDGIFVGSPPKAAAAKAVDFATEVQREEGERFSASGSQWAGTDFRVSYRFEGQTFVHTPTGGLLPSKFGFWLDRFEKTRMRAQPKQVDALVRAQKKALIEQENKHSELFSKQVVKDALKTTMTHGFKKISESLVDEPGTLTPRMCYQKRLTDASLKNLLEKVFNAADEEKTENSIGSQYFTGSKGQASAAVRGLYKKLWNRAVAHPGHKTSHVQKLRICPFGYRVTREVLEGFGSHAASTGLVKREELQAAMQRSDRFSIQEAAFVMQTIPSNDRGEVEFEALPTLLQILRRESVNNSVLENDGDAIKVELCQSIADV